MGKDISSKHPCFPVPCLSLFWSSTGVPTLLGRCQTCIYTGSFSPFHPRFFPYSSRFSDFNRLSLFVCFQTISLCSPFVHPLFTRCSAIALPLHKTKKAPAHVHHSGKCTSARKLERSTGVPPVTSKLSATGRLNCPQTRYCVSFPAAGTDRVLTNVPKPS